MACREPVDGWELPVGPVVLTICPRMYLEGWEPLLDRIFDLWRHWSKGQLQLWIPDPSEGLGRLLLTMDEEGKRLDQELANNPVGRIDGGPGTRGITDRPQG